MRVRRVANDTSTPTPIGTPLAPADGGVPVREGDEEPTTYGFHPAGPGVWGLSYGAFCIGGSLCEYRVCVCV
ncbi:MAG: hypothetical protein P4L40_01830 [Terracidiphilus sp.]|nr:hypothetical protein [Terracidiphilus sp.]